MDVKSSKRDNSLLSRRARYLLAATFGLVVILGQVLVINPILRAYVLDFVVDSLASKGIILSATHARPEISWSAYPPALKVSNVHLEVYDDAADLSSFTEVEFDRIEYRIERTVLWPPAAKLPGGSIPKATQPLVSFATIVWYNCTVTLHELHPQPRITLQNGRINLSSPSLRTRRQQLRHHISSWLWQGEMHLVPDLPRRLLDVYIQSVRITTHSITSIPLSVTHPTMARLITNFPTFFGLFTKPPGSAHEGQAPEYPIIYPPHLSLFAPSLVLPAVYQGLSSLRQADTPNNTPIDNTITTYLIPTPFSHVTLQVHLVRRGVKKMQHLTLSLVRDREEAGQCSSILVGTIESLKLSGRDAGGAGGCCSLQIRGTGNITPPFEPLDDSSFTRTSSRQPMGMRSLITERILKGSEGIVAFLLHPFYIASYALSLRGFLTKTSEPNLCALQEALQYHIVELSWVDQTPTTSSTIGRAMAQVHNGFLNLFEDLVALVT